MHSDQSQLQKGIATHGKAVRCPLPGKCLLVRARQSLAAAAHGKAVRCPLPGKCLLVRARQSLAGLIAQKNALRQITLSEDEILSLRVTTSVTGSLRSLCPVSRIYIPTQFILRFNSFPYNGGIPVRVNQICHPYLSSDSFRPDCSQVIAPLTLLFPRTFRKLSESMLPWKSCPVLRFGFFQSAFIISQKSGLSIEN